jgi:hypothetical protein
MVDMVLAPFAIETTDARRGALSVRYKNLALLIKNKIDLIRLRQKIAVIAHANS